ncbi:acylneuraminate cytidylyltransferase family protein [Paenibacillus alkalitolerans]|uniref:acylneuraminate cytidylyltransferase family protein n=1 Tax=Paenibacillus alkalitolerans TaxID=2799335 RepID=UPI0018F38A0A|nr:acylneuraminate cytidylyltransferase family protein [Paenibacillus alkalitolerans]
MIGGRRILTVIPARGGSKGIPRKNLYRVAGKPLIAWTIEEAKKSKFIDRLIVSSDDEEIMETAVRYGCEAPFRRPNQLAKDETPGVEPILHAVEEISGYDYVVLLQPTSPLRTVSDIDGCLELCVGSRSASCVSVTETEENPYWMFRINEDNRMLPVLPEGSGFTRRQDLPPCYVLNGAVYVSEITALLKNKSFLHEDTVAYRMPRERSLDIDDMEDILEFERRVQNRSSSKMKL